jgi:hypothetical protein
MRSRSRHIGVSGVVHDHVDPPEALARLVQGIDDAARIGDVERQREDAVAELDDDVIELLGSACGGDDAIAGTQCRENESATEAARGPCDKPCLTHEVNETPLH